MFRRVLIGIVGGAAGTVGLNIATYLDMAIRGRPASEVPAQTAEKIAMSIGLLLDRSAPPVDPE